MDENQFLEISVNSKPENSKETTKLANFSEGENGDNTKQGAPSIENEIIKFSENLASLSSSLFQIRAVIIENSSKLRNDFQSFLKENSREVANKKGIKSFELNQGSEKQLLKLIQSIKLNQKSIVTLHNSYLFLLISYFDLLLNGILRWVFYKKPEILNSCGKTFTLQELISSTSLQDVINNAIDQEIDGFGRMSHTEKIKWLETKLHIKIKENLKYWSEFIEITERRNLITHTDGIVTDQYLRICNQEGYCTENIPKGSELKVGNDYFNNAYLLIYETGIRISQVIWLKFDPDQTESANWLLNQMGYSALTEGKYLLAQKIFDFSLETQLKIKSKEYYLLFLINRAQSYKWLGDEDRAKQIINSEDWSVVNDKYRLAKEIILDNFGEAISFMKKIGDNGDISKNDYREWPLFQRIREDKTFQNTFETIFHESFYSVKLPKIDDQGNDD